MTDKTGTLTKNEMVFKQLVMEFAAFKLDEEDDERKEFM
jgi:magnesium-transporting ATPase (P-type)